MRNLILFSVVALLAGPAFANGNDCEGNCGNGGGRGGDSSSLSVATAFGGRGGSGGDASSLNRQSMVVDGDDFSKMPGTPASVYVDACSSGASVSSQGFGASLGNGDDFCKKLTLATAYRQAGDVDLARTLLDEARRDLAHSRAVSRYFTWIPFIGGLL
jgi:hypothetical protein